MIKLTPRIGLTQILLSDEFSLLFTIKILLQMKQKYAAFEYYLFEYKYILFVHFYVFVWIADKNEYSTAEIK